MDDHPIFAHFRPYRGFVPLHSSVGFVGDFTHYDMERQSSPWRPFASVGPPPVDEEYFEWIDLLAAVKSAGSTFTMIEVGAGYGRWSVRGAKAARQLSKAAVIGAVEAEPRHLQWLQRNFKQNGVRDHRIVSGVVDGVSGLAPFAIGAPDEAQYEGGWFGQAQLDYRIELFERTEQQYMGHDVYAHSHGWKILKLPRIALSAILEPYGMIDIVDMDIQGAEAAAVAEAIEPLTRKVRRLHIGTHSHDVETQLRQTLSQAGWVSTADYACTQINPTPYGLVAFVDGVQSWSNPALPDVVNS